ncbi:MAG: glycoside hydrolase family 3 N-terminal domain-containing protein [Nakamurella sp.]
MATARPATTGLRITAADERRAEQQVAALSVREQAALVLMPAASEVGATVSSVRYGGVILMGSDGVVDGTGRGTPAEVRDYVSALQAQRPAAWGPMLVAVDQEYGDVARLVNGFTEFPGASVLAAGGRDDAVQLTERAATAAAQEMRAVGVTIDFAPDADVLPTDGRSAIGDRSYGTDPATVGSFVAAAVRGYQSGGVAATLKHFPGIGGLSSDTHEVLPTVEQPCASWNRSSRVPFAAGIDAGAALVMTGHVLFPAAGVSAEPASLSPTAVDDVLRGKGSSGCSGLGFAGISVSDSFQMAPVADAFSPGEAAWRALAAGQDLILLPASPGKALSGIVDAVDSGQLPAGRLRDAATRILTLQAATDNVVVPPLSVVNSAEHRALAAAARG